MEEQGKFGAQLSLVPWLISEGLASMIILPAWKARSTRTSWISLRLSSAMVELVVVVFGGRIKLQSGRNWEEARVEELRGNAMARWRGRGSRALRDPHWTGPEGEVIACGPRRSGALANRQRFVAHVFPSN